MAEPLRPRLLLVDDAPINLQMLEAGLEDAFECRCATGGAEALALMGSWLPDLVLLDVAMPGLDGLAVCRRLKADPALQDIPVIFVTGRDDEADELEGLEAGAVDYITKPFSLPIVKARVGTHLELKRCRDLLRNHAFVDGLTGIANRRRFDEALAQAWALGVRQRSPVGLVLLDVDHFKAYNDAYGHPAGDGCLSAVARALAGAMPRVSDLVARYGGEEFVVLLPGTDFEGARAVAETLRRAVEAMGLPHAHSSAADHVTVSLGAASCLPHLKLVSAALVEAADEALYRAKQAGRNRVGG
ncbi:MAG: diguanylate cyclase [Holophagaceae bacterium]|nr:diguanylate cyclase [Holophagaceae bacterium]